MKPLPDFGPLKKQTLPCIHRSVGFAPLDTEGSRPRALALNCHPAAVQPIRWALSMSHTATDTSRCLRTYKRPAGYWAGEYPPE